MIPIPCAICSMFFHSNSIALMRIVSNALVIPATLIGYINKQPHELSSRSSQMMGYCYHPVEGSTCQRPNSNFIVVFANKVEPNHHRSDGNSISDMHDIVTQLHSAQIKQPHESSVWLSQMMGYCHRLEGSTCQLPDSNSMVVFAKEVEPNHHWSDGNTISDIQYWWFNCIVLKSWVE
jgi:hypothetical protein